MYYFKIFSYISRDFQSLSKVSFVTKIRKHSSYYITLHPWETNKDIAFSRNSECVHETYADITSG